MKIAFVLDDTLDSTDGVQQYIIRLGDAYRNKGHEVHYIVGHTKRRDIPNIHSLSRNIKVGFNQNRLSTPLPAPSIKIKRLLKRHKFDIIHVQMPFSPFLASKVIKQAKKLNIPSVATFHILPASSVELQSLKMLAKAQSRRVSELSKIIAVSEPAKHCVQDAYNIHADVIPNPVDLEAFRTSSQKAEDARIKIVFLGRLVERKGCLQFLQSLQWLHDREMLEGVKVAICGDGPQLLHLKAYVLQHKLQSYVTFEGKISESDKIKQLASADIAVFPSMSGESFGIVLIEAMAAGSRVVLAGDNPGYRSVMANREQQLVNPTDTQVFAAQLLHFMQSSSEREKAHKWQKKHVRQFSLDDVSVKLLKLYEEVIAKNELNSHN